MSDFKEAFDFVMQHEDAQLSGVVTTDAGGHTRFGIAQKFHPDLDNSFFDGPAADALAAAEQIYEHDYWEAMRLTEVESQNIANKLFDMGVNMGTHQAVHLAQRALNALISTGAQPPPAAEPLLEDGIIGDHTVAAINAADPIQLHGMIVEVCKAFYIHVATNNPAQAVYLHGWLKRAES
jgi:lysozyme family protein